MVPLQLQIKNFLSYGSEVQTIDFGPYNLICLSGKNGHGKSALLDAITWAIWGYARKTIGAAKADQGLLRLGQDNMLVYLDFYYNEIQYRVRRELTIHHNKPIASLDFGIVQQDGSCISLTDKTIRATQEKIERTIKLDFESFCNSTFLRQGQSNEFCKKSPKDRKDILTRILGLEKYEQLRQLALEKAKICLYEKQQIITLQETLATDIAQKDTLQQSYKALVDTIQTVDQEIYALESSIVTQQKILETVIEKERAYAVTSFALEQNANQIQETRNKIQALRNEWKTTHRLLLNISSYEHTKKELLIVTQAIQGHQEKLQKILSLKESFLQKKQVLQQYESTWNSNVQNRIQEEKNKHHILLIELKKHESLSQHIREKQAFALTQQQEAQQTKDSLTALIDDIQKIQPVYEMQKKQFDKRKEAYQQYSAEGTIRTQQLKELRHKQALVYKTQEASCPLCEQTVSASRRRFLESKYAQEELFLTQRIKRLSHTVKELKLIMVQQHADLEPLEKKMHVRSVHESHRQSTLQLLSTINQSIASLANDCTATQLMITSLQEHIKQQEAVITQLESTEKNKLFEQEQYVQYKQAVTNLESEAHTIQYNGTAHKEDEKKQKNLQKMIEQYTDLLNQKPLQEDRKKNIIELCNMMRTLYATKKELSHALPSFKDITLQLQHIRTEILSLEHTIKEKRITKEQWLHQQGSLEIQLQKISLNEATFKQRATEIQQKTTQHQELCTIAHAMGKDGIQALLIEEVIPDIEHEANELLSRLTQNQAHIIIESLKDLKSGKTKETLDIFISDGLGIRPYELFSGGEAFRIDFALRIAISKLVARKAGTALQTLIIDEGFGSQDEEGLSLIMDALHAIQHDFEKIIIVSHLPFMKDQFPVHFTIEKGPMGSNISVYHQG